MARRPYPDDLLVDLPMAITAPQVHTMNPDVVLRSSPIVILVEYQRSVDCSSTVDR